MVLRDIIVFYIEKWKRYLNRTPAKRLPPGGGCHGGECVYSNEKCGIVRLFRVRFRRLLPPLARSPSLPEEGCYDAKYYSINITLKKNCHSGQSFLLARKTAFVVLITSEIAIISLSVQSDSISFIMAKET